MRLGEEATNLELSAKGGHGVGLSHDEDGGRRLLGSGREREGAAGGRDGDMYGMRFAKPQGEEARREGEAGPREGTKRK